jgi:hypothetical protein
MNGREDETFSAKALFMGVFNLDDRFLESKTMIIRRECIEWQGERIMPRHVTVTPQCNGGTKLNFTVNKATKGLWAQPVFGQTLSFEIMFTDSSHCSFSGFFNRVAFCDSGGPALSFMGMRQAPFLSATDKAAIACKWLCVGVCACMQRVQV